MPQTSVPDAGSSGIEPSRSISPPLDENMPSDDEDSETIRKALQSSGPETADAEILNPRHPDEIAPNAPIGEIDTSMHSPSAGEAPQPNTASAALQIQCQEIRKMIILPIMMMSPKRITDSPDSIGRTNAEISRMTILPMVMTSLKRITDSPDAEIIVTNR